jgi:hypothetical protein
VGADGGMDDEGLKDIWALSKRGQEWLHHHFGNSLCAIQGALLGGDIALAKKELKHAISDLNKMRSLQERRQLEAIQKLFPANCMQFEQKGGNDEHIAGMEEGTTE